MADFEIVSVGDRFEARQGNKVIAWHTSAERAAAKAVERLEEDRLRKLPYNEGVDLRTTKKMNGHTAPPTIPRPPAPARAAPVVVLAPPAPVPPVVDEATGTPLKVIKGSIIKSKYKERYKKHGMSCGDLIASELTLYVMVLDQGKARLDLKKLREVAEINMVWKDRYIHLNPGQQRMTIGNCLRQKYAAGDQIDIGGAPFQMEFAD